MLDAHQHVPAQGSPPLPQSYPPAPVARPALGGRLSGLGAIQRSPRVVAAAFAGAVGLGVIIGLVTAPHGEHDKPVPVTAKPVDPKAAPAIPASAWGGTRQPGSTRQMVIPTTDANRVALRYVYGQQVHQPVDAVVIPLRQLYYGVVQGTTAADDQFYAAGLVEVSGGPETLVVWERKGTGAWRVNHEGPGSCDTLPGELYGKGAWGIRPALCNAG